MIADPRGQAPRCERCGGPIERGTYYVVRQCYWMGHIVAGDTVEPVGSIFCDLDCLRNWARDHDKRPEAPK